MRIPLSSVREELGAIDVHIAACIGAVPMGFVEREVLDPAVIKRSMNQSLEMRTMPTESVRMALGAIPLGEIKKSMKRKKKGE